jgi:hypothetical protein
LARGPRDGFHDTRKADLESCVNDVTVRRDYSIFWLTNRRRRETLSHDDLVASRDGRVERVVPQTKPRRGRTGDDKALVVDSQYRVERVSNMQLGDGFNGAANIVEGKYDGAVTHGARHRLSVFGAYDDVNLQSTCGDQKISRPVRRGRQQQQDTGHPPMMAASVR